MGQFSAALVEYKRRLRYLYPLMNMIASHGGAVLDNNASRAIFEQLLDGAPIRSYYGDGEINTATVSRSSETGFLLSVDEGRDDGGHDFAFDSDCIFITDQVGAVAHGARVVASDMLLRVQSDVAAGALKRRDTV